MLSLINSIKKITVLPLIIACGLVLLPQLKASASPRGVEVFSVNTPGHDKTINPKSNNLQPIPVSNWFAKFDNLTEQYHPSDGDKVILTRPFNQQADRVQQWTNTANKIAKNYMTLARSIRSLPPPSGAPDVKEYRNLMADWYQDAAGIYEDLIRPRPPARTVEDLEEQLEAVKRRSDSLADNIASLKAMDRSLRKEYNVEYSLQDDIIQQIVRQK